MVSSGRGAGCREGSFLHSNVPFYPFEGGYVQRDNYWLGHFGSSSGLLVLPCGEVEENEFGIWIFGGILIFESLVIHGFYG